MNINWKKQKIENEKQLKRAQKRLKRKRKTRHIRIEKKRYLFVKRFAISQKITISKCVDKIVDFYIKATK